MNEIKIAHPTKGPGEYYDESELASLAESIIRYNSVSSVKFYKHFGTESTTTTVKYYDAISVQVVNSGRIYQY